MMESRPFCPADEPSQLEAEVARGQVEGIADDQEL